MSIDLTVFEAWMKPIAAFSIFIPLVIAVCLGLFYIAEGRARFFLIDRYKKSIERFKKGAGALSTASFDPVENRKQGRVEVCAEITLILAVSVTAFIWMEFYRKSKRWKLIRHVVSRMTHD